jgi:hypothetical protein
MMNCVPFFSDLLHSVECPKKYLAVCEAREKMSRNSGQFLSKLCKDVCENSGRRISIELSHIRKCHRIIKASYDTLVKII